MEDASKTSDIGSSLNQSWKSIRESCNRLFSNPQGTLRSAAVGVVGKLIQPILKGRFITNPVHDHDDFKLPNHIQPEETVVVRDQYSNLFSRGRA
jgi:chromosome condensin MukBEF complex kleisin-like MukF subunit